MMRGVPELLWIVPAVPAALDWAAVSRGDLRTERWAKPLTLVAVIAVALALGAAGSPPGRWLVVGLALGLVGDVALLGKSTGRFRAGLAAFLLGHLAYLACFAALGLPSPAWAWAVVLPLGATLLAVRRVLPATHRSDGPALSVPVGLYTAVIAAMLVLAWLTGAPLVAAGATVFTVSDSVLAVNRFDRPLPHAQLVIMVTYHLGQGLIAAGVLGAA